MISYLVPLRLLMNIYNKNPDHAESRGEVRKYMSKNSGGIVFSTIQKFSPNFDAGEEHMPILTNRSNVIVMVDEAHRSQYGMQAKLTDNGIRYGYAKYLREALPNASFIGFTGTPINTEDKSTVAMFGNYILMFMILLKQLMIMPRSGFIMKVTFSH